MYYVALEFPHIHFGVLELQVPKCYHWHVHQRHQRWPSRPCANASACDKAHGHAIGLSILCCHRWSFDKLILKKRIMGNPICGQARSLANFIFFHGKWKLNNAVCAASHRLLTVRTPANFDFSNVLIVRKNGVWFLIGCQFFFLFFQRSYFNFFFHFQLVTFLEPLQLYSIQVLGNEWVLVHGWVGLWVSF